MAKQRQYSTDHQFETIRVNINEIIKDVVSLKAKHDWCEDDFYSCPKAPGGCGNTHVGKECTCGAEGQHKKIDSIAKKLKAIIQQ
jgi:hypothetical protein